MVPLGSVCRFINGGTPSKSIQNYFEGDIPWITSADISGPIANFARSFITEEAISNSAVNKVSAGAVLLVTRTGVGKVAIVENDLCFSQDITALIPDKPKLDAGYLAHFLRTKKPHFLSLARGATIQGITRNVVSELSIPLPPLSEQLRITAILDQADGLRVKRREALEQLDSLTQSIFIEMFGDPVVNPMDWQMTTLKELGKVKTGGTPPSNRDGMFGGSVPFVTPGDLNSNEPVKRTVTELGAAAASVVRSGATLVCCIGATIGKMAKVKDRSAFNQQINAVEWDITVDDDYGFTALTFLKRQIATQGASTTLPILKKSSFEKLIIPVPPIALQKEFSRRVLAIETLKVSQRNALTECDNLFTSLQQRAFNGEL